MRDVSFASTYPRLAADLSTQPKLLPVQECDALALRFASRGDLPLEPTVAYAFGTGYILHQPMGGELTTLVVTSSLEIAGRSTSFR
jgi:hypothetical protein